MHPNIQFIEKEIAFLREQLKTHNLYKELGSVNDIKIFMQQHVFAVWDFMSLLKALQINLTSVSLPWVPKKNTNLVRFINEITLAEESDVDKDGSIKSHYEMYVDAMEEMQAKTDQIHQFVTQVSKGEPIEKLIETLAVPTEVKEFLAFTFAVIKTNETHKVASAFTFGREDLIPDMFLKIVDETEKKHHKRYDSFVYYLKRHIELDGDEHGPLSLQMIEELCGNDDEKWNEVLEVAKQSLQVRINLWNSIEKELSHKKAFTLA